MDDEIIILWVGIGYAEEAILLTLYIQHIVPHICVKIIGIDIHAAVVDKAIKNIKKFNCGEMISICTFDVMSITRDHLMSLCGGKLPSLIYTSAAASDLFNYKMLSLCVFSEASLLCNRNTVKAAGELLAAKAKLLVNAELHSDVEVKEPRDIFLIQYPHLEININAIFSHVNQYMCLDMTAEQIRGYTFFINLISKISNMAEKSHIFEREWDLSLEGAPFQIFISKITVPAHILNTVVTVYADSNNDQLRHVAKEELSKHFMSMISAVLFKSVEDCFTYGVVD